MLLRPFCSAAGCSLEHPHPSRSLRGGVALFPLLLLVLFISFTTDFSVLPGIRSGPGVVRWQFLPVPLLSVRFHPSPLGHSLARAEKGQELEGCSSPAAEARRELA